MRWIWNRASDMSTAWWIGGLLLWIGPVGAAAGAAVEAFASAPTQGR